MNLSIAVISDLHVGNSARGKDLNPEASNWATDDNYLESFNTFITENNIKADYLAIPGDITNKATPAEFSLASSSILKIAETLGVPKNRIFYVPGNHDKNWEIAKALAASDLEQKTETSYAPLMNDELIFKKLIQAEHVSGHYDKKPYYTSWLFDDLIAIGINSSVHDAPEAITHHGLVRKDVIESLSKELPKYKNDNRLKILIVHHHPITYSDPIAEEADFSGMTNAAELTNLLSKERFDFIIHGHKHNPCVQSLTGNHGHPLVILCSGSFSSLLDARWSGTVQNQFHLLKFSSRCPDKKTARGHLSSWSYLCAHGWTKSKNDSHGIDHTLGFGAYHDPTTLKNEISSIIIESVENNTIFEWSEILETNPELTYVSKEMIITVLEEIKEEENFYLRPADELANYILFKR